MNGGVNGGFAVRPGSKSGIDLGELVIGGVNGSASGSGVNGNGVVGGEDEDDEGPEKQLERESKGRMSIDGSDATVDADRMQH